MKIFIFTFLITLNFCYAEVGSVLKISGNNNAYLVRNDKKLSLSTDMLLELNDKIFSNEAYLVIYVFPGTQMSLAHHTEVTISELLIEENKDLQKSFSVIDFIKGIIRVQVTRSEDEIIEQKIQAQDVAFAVRGTEFEVSYDQNKDVDLDVMEGEVVVSSPHVHSFVPEIVKRNEGFRFRRNKKLFARRKFAPKFKKHPGFLSKDRLKTLKQLRKERRKKSRRKSIRNKMKNRKIRKQGRKR